MLKAFIALVIIFCINIPSMYYGWYLQWSWFDVALHFLGGFFVAMLLWNFFQKYVGTTKLANLVIVCGLTALVGIFWELAEYTANQTLVEPFYRWFEIRAYFIGDLRDTLFDLAMDISGGAVYYFLHLLRRRNSHQV